MDDVMDRPGDHLPAGAEAIAAVDEVLARLEAFCADLRAQGIHVGVNGRCAACREPWPCPTTQTDDEALRAMRAGGKLGGLLKDGKSIDEALEASVELGWLEHAGVDDDGCQLYRMTQTGMAVGT